MNHLHILRSFFSDFARNEDGAATVEFVVVFSVFITFFLMTIENGIISLRHVMLERGVDLAVRDIRLGRVGDAVGNPGGAVDRANVRELICRYSLVIPDCENQLQLKMDVNSLRIWNQNVLAAGDDCVDRGDPGNPANLPVFRPGINNQLVVLRACARIDPFFPTTGIGKAIVDAGDTKSGDSYALISTAAYVIEPVAGGGGGTGGTPAASGGP